MRHCLLLPLGSVVLLGAGCGSSGAAAPDLGPRSMATAAEIDQMKAACSFTAGTAAGLTLPQGAPLGPELPIQTAVVVMMENRSFDHLLSDLPASGQPDVDVATAAMTNKDSKGVAVPFHHLTELCFGDTNHEWDGSHLEYGDGRNDGFVVANEAPPGMANPPLVPADGERAMGYYTAADVPFLHGLATTFAIADRYFCSLLGPTFPNRDFFYAGTSFGEVGGQVVTPRGPTLVSRLDDAGIDWHEYYETIPGLGTLGLFKNGNIDSLSTLFVDAAAGALAPFVLVDPDLAARETGAKDDFHPPGDLQLGDQFLDKVVTALMKSPQWGHMAIFVTFDEHGGLYDHVPPPPACPPDDFLPMAPATGRFDRLGFRVPLIVISPYAKRGYVSHRVYDHTSITRFVESLFVLPALTARDANADPLYDLFDFTTPAFATPPALTPSSVDEAKVAACKASFPGEK